MLKLILVPLSLFLISCTTTKFSESTMTYKTGTSNKGLILKIKSPYITTEKKSFGFIAMVEKPKYLIDSLIIIQDDTKLWKIINIKPKEPLLEINYGKSPSGYLQIFPEKNRPKPLEPGKYRIEYYINTEKNILEIEI